MFVSIIERYVVSSESKSQTVPVPRTFKMQIVVKGKTGQTPGETFLIEMQGDLESRKNEHLEGKFIGDLHYSKGVCLKM